MSRYLDRALQRRILELLADAYPQGLRDVARALAGADDDAALFERPAVVNTQYLAEHGLVASGYRRRNTIGKDEFAPDEETTITAAGLDFLSDDGGLGAILGVLTVRFAPDTLAELVAARIDVSDLPPAEKSRLTQALSSLGQEAWSEATKRLVGAALDHWPTALAWLRTLPG